MAEAARILSYQPSRVSLIFRYLGSAHSHSRVGGCWRGRGTFCCSALRCPIVLLFIEDRSRDPCMLHFHCQTHDF